MKPSHPIIALLLLTSTVIISPAGAQQSGNAPPPENGDSATTETDSAENAESECDCAAEAAAVDTPAPPPQGGFSGEGGLGWIINSGNTNNESVNGDLSAKYIHQPWQHRVTLSAKRVRDEQTTTAERYVFTGKTDYNYGDQGYAFVVARYDDDRFSGYDYQASLSSGLGWHIINADDHHLDMEIGIGYRRNQPTPTAATPADDDSAEEIISRLAEHYDVVLTDSTEFFQDLLIESGDSNTTSELGLGLKVDMNDSVALQLSYNVKRNSNPPDSGDPDDPTVKTDRTMRLSLVFGF